MADVRKYYANIQARTEKLDEQFPNGIVCITSLHDPLRGMVGDTVTEVSTRLAAKQLEERAARLSTDDEIKAHVLRGENRATMNRELVRRINPGADPILYISTAPEGK